MIEKYYEALQKRENLRENLVGLRAQIKDEAAKEQFVSMIGDGGLLLELLEEEDPKVRKNVAMILGELEWMGAADALVTAYEREQTLFVKSTYLKALAYLDITAYQERFKTRTQSSGAGRRQCFLRGWCGYLRCSIGYRRFAGSD